MNTDMYDPPKSNVSIKENLKSQPIKAIILASLFDIVGTYVFYGLYDAAYVILLVNKGLSGQEAYESLQSLDFFSINSLSGMFIGTVISFIGGYMCARIANKNEYLVVLLLAIIVIASGYIEGFESYSLIQNISLGLATFISMYLGAWIYVRRKYNVASSPPLLK